MRENIERLPDMDYSLLRDDVYREVIRQHPDLSDKGDVMLPVIDKALGLIDRLEHAAYQSSLIPPPKALWLITAPGTSQEPVKKTDPAIYKDPERFWFQWMQRTRIDYTDWLVRRCTEISIGQDLSTKRFTPELKIDTGSHGPWVIINGNQIENDDFQQVVQRKDTAFSPDRIHIIKLEPEKTIGQVLTFSLPDDIVWKSEDKLGIVCHAPQMVRLLYMMNHPGNKFADKIPKGMQIQLFPMPTPAMGRKSYVEQEIVGLMRYIFKDNAAAEDPYSYSL